MKHSILIVDDDKLITNTLQKRFESFSMDVYTAPTSEEAKKILEKYSPEVVILDLLLTTEDGSMGILDYMKSQPRLESVPVIVLTNLDKPELKDMLMRQGVKEFLIKGKLSLDELYDKVVSYLEPLPAGGN